MFSRSVLLACACMLVLGACQIDLVLDVVVEADGSGRVEFTVAADDEVMDFVDIDDVDLTDLSVGGWELSGPVISPDGTAITLAKDVPSASQFDDVIAQIDEGRLFDEVVLDIDVGIGSTTYDASLTVAPRLTARDFSDADLIELLDGEPFGERTEVLEERAGRSLDESVTVSATLTMPDGSSDSVSVTLADPEESVLTGSTSFVDDTVDDRRAAAAEAKETFDDSIRTVAVFWAIAAVLALVLLSLGWRRRRRLFREQLFGD